MMTNKTFTISLIVFGLLLISFSYIIEADQPQENTKGIFLIKSYADWQKAGFNNTNYPCYTPEALTDFYKPVAIKKEDVHNLEPKDVEHTFKYANGSFYERLEYIEFDILESEAYYVVLYHMKVKASNHPFKLDMRIKIKGEELPYTWFNSSWEHYKNVTITNKILGYQSMLHIFNESGHYFNLSGYLGNGNFTDVVFVNPLNNTILPYWRERTLENDSCWFWVNNKYNLSYYHMYFGNSNFTGDYQNGSACFPVYFDDFSTDNTGDFAEYQEDADRSIWYLKMFDAGIANFNWRYKLYNEVLTVSSAGCYHAIVFRDLIVSPSPNNRTEFWSSSDTDKGSTVNALASRILFKDELTAIYVDYYNIPEYSSKIVNTTFHDGVNISSSIYTISVDDYLVEKHIASSVVLPDFDYDVYLGYLTNSGSAGEDSSLSVNNGNLVFYSARGDHNNQIRYYVDWMFVGLYNHTQPNLSFSAFYNFTPIPTPPIYEKIFFQNITWKIFLYCNETFNYNISCNNSQYVFGSGVISGYYHINLTDLCDGCLYTINVSQWIGNQSNNRTYYLDMRGNNLNGENMTIYIDSLIAIQLIMLLFVVGTAKKDRVIGALILFANSFLILGFIVTSIQYISDEILFIFMFINIGIGVYKAWSERTEGRIIKGSGE